MNKKLILWLCFLRGKLFLIPFLLLANAVCAQTAQKYVAYTADINGDGRPDVFVKAIPNVLILSLDEDFDVPIVIAPAIPSFILLSDSTGDYQIRTNIGDMPSNPLWRQEGVTVIVNKTLTSGMPTLTIDYSGSNAQAFVSGTAYVADAQACNSGACSSTGFAINVFSSPTPLGSWLRESYEYNALGRLVKVRRNGVLKTQYDYDGAGNRKQVLE